MADLIAARLRAVPKELRRTVRPALATAGERVRQRAAGNASWSTRIPSSLRVKTSFGGRNPGVFVSASAGRAPNARPLENITGKRDTIRHPTFGHEDRQVDQPTRPFLAPANAELADSDAQAIVTALDAALTAAGFR
jgi:hypothetical protein